MKPITAFCCCMVCCSSALANLYGSDNFDDNVMDPAKWSVFFGNTLNETNGRLELSGGSGEVGGAWIWELNSGSYVQDWTVSLDVFNYSDETTLSDQRSGFGFIAYSPGPFDNTFSVGLIVGDDAGGSNPYRRILTEAEDTHAQVLDHAVDTTADALQLQISFDASTKVLTSYYDAGGGQTVLTNYNTGSWGLTDSDVFTVALYGESFDMTPVSGEVFGDNFMAIPEPGTLGLLSVALGGMLLARRKKR